VRDEDAQKAFSKLRNAIGASIYQWRADRAAAGPWTLSANEIQDLPGMINRLRQHSDPLSAYLWQNLSDPEQLLLLNYQPPASSSNQAQAAVVQALNKIVGETNIYEPARFKDVSLRSETSFLLQQNPRGVALAQLNRLLLEDAYPHELSINLCERMTKEAEFALKQSFAFCPFSPEAVCHLMILFLSQRRLEDVRLILATAQKLDPHNEQFNSWLANVEGEIARQGALTAQLRLSQVQQLAQAGRNAEAETLLDTLTQDPHADLNTLSIAAMGYAGVGKPAKGAAVMQKLAASHPDDWMLWLYLAQLRAVDGKAAGAADALGRAFALNTSDRVTNQNHQSANFHDFVRQDKSFDAIRQTPEYRKAMGIRN
jgi:predicted Zn-dependent protease